jgi:hypothetical protein
VTGKARDVLYGRQGGGWLPDKPARPVPEGHERTPVDLTDRFRPETDDDWEGKARMAKARQAAGASLSAVDLQALDRYPDPPMLGATP